MQYVDLDEIYRTIPQGEIPWNSEKPPKALIRLVDAGKVRPCKTIDFGCGTSNYAIYLASSGFNVTGVDYSHTAIRIAEDKARAKGVRCSFIAAEALSDLEELRETFDLAYDWELLHHIFPE